MESLSHSSAIKEKQLTPFWKSAMIMIGLSGVMILLLIYMGLSSLSIHRNNFPLISAAYQLSLDITTSHLWFEEIISGDRNESLQTVNQLIKRAYGYLEAIEYGGTINNIKILAINDEKLLNHLNEIEEYINNYQTILFQRYSIREKSGIGSEIDQKFDAVFKNLLKKTKSFEEKIRVKVNQDVQAFQFSLIILIGVIISITILSIWIFNKYEREKKESFNHIKKIQSQLEKSEHWLSTTMHSIGDGLITTDTQGNVTFVNPVAAELTGWTDAEAKGQPIESVFNIINEKTKKPASNPIHKVIKENKVIGLANHTALISRDGRIFSIADSGAPIISADNKLMGVVLIFRDVSEEKKMLEQLKELRKYLQNIINSMPSLLAGVNPEGRITLWNMKAEEVTGIKAKEARGRPLMELLPFFHHGMEEINRAIKQRQSHKKEKIETRIDGDTTYSDLTIYPLIANGVDGAVIRIDDVTDRIRMEELMIQSEKMMSVGGLAAGMAHEINNPLAGILQNAQIIKNRLSEDMQKNIDAAKECGIEIKDILNYIEKRDIGHMIDLILESGNRASKITHDMLSFSRKSEHHFDSHSPTELLDQTIELAGSDYDLKKEYDFRQIEIIKEYQPDLPDIKCNGNQIQQVILNILKNGAQAMIENKDKGKASKFYIRALKENKSIRIEIEDNGPGMEDKIKEKIFEPFYTTKKKTKGTGLGLSVSNFIISISHSGSIEVFSKIGEGTKFVILLPINLEGK